MEILVTLPDYKSERGFKFEWESGFEIKVLAKENSIRLIANKEGLISLAKQFLNLAQDHFPEGYHLHYDDQNSLEEGSTEFVLEKA